MHNWGVKRNLTLSQQLLFLKTNPNTEGGGGVGINKLVWRFHAQPTPISRNYGVRIEYKVGDSPNVFIEDPDLTLLAEGRNLPHVYNNPLRLCLYMPRTGQWSASKRIDQTIVPWAYIWLYYFEDWLVFGKWNGGGKHPDEDQESGCNRRLRRSFART